MKTRSITLIALFVAVMIAFGAIPTLVIPFVPVPFTFQMLGVMLVGSILGAKRGFVSMLVFIALVAAGMPVLSGYHGGLGVLLGPTGGYVLAWPLAVLVIGWLIDRTTDSKWNVVQYYLAIFLGILLIYLIGVPWFALYSHIAMGVAVAGNVPLFLLDCVKAVIATAVAVPLRQRLRVLRHSHNF
ncbi:MAG: biotin transporter BioY [Sporolactobacillus sp.]|jgi:biotin transport system substrate-specific component|nr:biotin transporter BioY [Sporolactobacillus sp.]